MAWQKAILGVSAALVVAVGGAGGLAGCTSQRPLPMVKEMGDRAFQKGDFETANKDYAEYVDRKPGEASVQLSYAKTLLILKQPAKAVEHASIAYDQYPENEDYIETRAQALLESGKTDELYQFLRGLAEGRGKPSDYIRLGRYAAKLGDADGAEHALQTAAKLDGGKTVAPQLALADFYKTLGDKKSEIRRLRMALYLDKTNPDITKRLRELGEIPGPSLALPPE
jgi:predicted Zn-dependent protease